MSRAACIAAMNVHCSAAIGAEPEAPAAANAAPAAAPPRPTKMAPAIATERAWLRDLRKDLDLAVELFDPALVRTPITAQARQLVTAAATEYGDLDITAVERPYRQVGSRVPRTR
jgi:3-hydroxyisobutyrate dehydrogenase-like beta-hydroxyacid dehydrogenase